VDLPIAVDVCCAPIVVPDDASVPDAPASEPSEAAEAAPVEAEAVPEAAPEAAPAVVKPPCGEELWNCVKDALAAEAWESKDPKVPSSLVVFDWDDTLLPTSALVAAKRIAPAPGATVAPCAAAAQLSDWELDDLLESCAKAATDALRKASKYGRVVIITNSGFGWVHETASRFMPSVLGELEKVPVISARAIFECQGVPEPYRWKVLCFRRIVECFSFDPRGETGPSSLISIGDGWQERLAAIMAAQDTDLALVKCMKFLEQPGMDQLVQQLNLCSQIFAGLVAHPGWVEASYSYNDVEGLQLEARADNTAALGGSFAASQVNGTVEVVSAEECQDMEGIEVEDVPQSCEKVENQRFEDSKADPNPANGKLNCNRPPRRRRCNKASLLARAGKMQALPLQQSYLTMGGRQKVATRRRWFQARKKSVRTLKATNIVKCNGTAL